MNEVKGCPGWHYGIMVHTDGDLLGTRQTFTLHHDDGRAIGPFESSRYRTTTLARKVGDRRRGWQHAAQAAIRSRA